MSEKQFEFYSDDYLIGVLDNVTGKTLNHFATIDLLNEQQEEQDKTTASKYEDDFRASHYIIRTERMQ